MWSQGFRRAVSGRGWCVITERRARKRERAAEVRDRRAKETSKVSQSKEVNTTRSRKPRQGLDGPVAGAAVEKRPAVLSGAAEALLEKIRTRVAKLGVIGLGYVGLPLACEFA